MKFPVVTLRQSDPQPLQWFGLMLVMINPGASFYLYGLTLIPAWISNYIHYKVWDEITYPFRNFNGATVEVWEWMINFTLHITGHVNTFLRLKLIHISKSAPRSTIMWVFFCFVNSRITKRFMYRNYYIWRHANTQIHTVFILLLYHNETNWTKSYVSFNSLRPIDAYMRQWIGHHWFR